MTMKLMMIISSLNLVMNNPMSMGFLLMTQTMMMILLMNKMMTSSWFTMITFMMMIGALLIMFMYMSSIASNEKFKMKANMMIIILIMLTMLISEEMMLESQIKETIEYKTTNNFNMSLTKIYNKKSMMLTIMLVMYLLLTMISVTKLVKHHKGPLRAMNYE
uniref:NADH dehydrogenase subunit 6 n=1 Tax=Yangisunda tiani TaxID=2873912 RepID=A0A9E6XTJ6_9HEMI|nr:NADH dehydrogenase subunit 6 [Yangisunda tiani]UGN61456.1 NADH dehydrogenase subunit 6 [Yangisunda tiani]